MLNGHFYEDDNDWNTLYCEVDIVDNNKIHEILQYLNMHPGFMKTYFEYMTMAEAGDEKAKQLIEIIVPADHDIFLVINEILKMAVEGDAFAKQFILDDFKG